VLQRLAPSVLNADLARLADQVRLVEEFADWIHLDLMDGHFVANLTFGPPVIASLRPHTDRYFDCHLMVAEPESLLPALAAAGANGVTLHVEALTDPARAIDAAKGHGFDVGLALRPATPLAAALPWLDRVDLLLPMTVEPGFGGQAFRPEVVPKIAAARRAIDQAGRAVALEVDGGVNGDTVALCRDAGADTYAIGTAIFHADDPAAAAKAFRSLIQAEGSGEPRGGAPENRAAGSGEPRGGAPVNQGKGS
jgi:ribulose-phosphate 3-epimerase